MYLPSSSPWPRLKGKAAEVKWFVVALSKVAEKRLNPNNQIEKWMLDGLQMSVYMETILNEYKDHMVLPEGEGTKFFKAACKFNLVVTALANHFHPQGVNLFNYTIKNHYLVDAGLQAQHINPRKGWCYAGEDFMQKIRKLWQSSCHGASPLRVGESVVKKYCCGMHFSMLADVA